METLKGLTQLQQLTQPIPPSVTNYYNFFVAKGSGEFGTYTMYDYLGSAAGYVTLNSIINVLVTLGTMNLSTLTEIYSRMNSVIKGEYDRPKPAPNPNPLQVIIPAGPGAGTYTNRNVALSSGLLPAANNEIIALRTKYPSQTNSLNNNFGAICQQYIKEYSNQTKAGLNFSELQSGSNQATISFAKNLPQFALDVVPNGKSDLITALADTTGLPGQAIVGCLREGRNNKAMDET